MTAGVRAAAHRELEIGGVRTAVAELRSRVAWMWSASAGPADVAALGERVAANVSSAVRVPPESVRAMLIALLAGGHVLIEDYPGVGKTALARALAASIDADCARVQCTADMLPSDLVGANVYVQRDARFEFRPGSGVREHRARRRDQPRLAEDPVGTARVHAGAARHGRRRRPTSSRARSS